VVVPVPSGRDIPAAHFYQNLLQLPRVLRPQTATVSDGLGALAIAYIASLDPTLCHPVPAVVSDMAPTAQPRNALRAAFTIEMDDPMAPWHESVYNARLR
jgi:hypothetical protein